MNILYTHEIDSPAYANLRQSLLKEKGSKKQIAFLEKVKKSNNFVDFMNENVGFPQDDKCIGLLEKMNEAEFKNPPPDTQKSIYENLRDLPPKMASRPSFWGYLTLLQIKNKRIESHYLAGDQRTQCCGEGRIQRVLEGESDTDIDRCVRTVFRRLSGLPEARGNRSVYVDCSLARSWWREKFLKEVVDEESELAQTVRNVLRINKAYWEEIVSMIVSRNSVFGSNEIRRSFLKAIALHLKQDPNSPLKTAEDLKLTSRALSSLQAVIELTVLDDDEIREKMQRLIKAQAEAAGHRRARSNSQ